LNASNPTHPGAVLREQVLPKLSGITKSELAKMLGVSRQTLYALLAERTGVSVEMALRLGTLVGNGPHYWLDMQSQFDMWQAQVKLNDELIKIKTLPDFPLKRISKFPTDRFS
jgi:addiction module HigA family antidote